jgi:hypothetical protein
MTIETAAMVGDAGAPGAFGLILALPAADAACKEVTGL